MTEAGSIAAGLILIIAAGVFNGSWNGAFSPKANLAVCKKTLKGKTENDRDTVEEPINDLMYHHAFALFQIYAALINIPICIFWAGGINRVNAIVAEAAKTPSSIVLIVLFSLLWGVGTLLFGLACKIAGVGLGTNLSMVIIRYSCDKIRFFKQNNMKKSKDNLMQHTIRFSVFYLFYLCIGFHSKCL